MKKLIVIALYLISLSACVKTPDGSMSPTTIDSVFNGSNFYIGYDINSYAAKDVVYGIHHYCTITATKTLVDSVHNILTIKVHAPTGTYGLPIINFYLLGIGVDTGYFKFATPTSWLKTTSQLSFINPDVVFTDTQGIAYINYNGSDHVEGQFTTNIFTPTTSYTATGNFKVNY